MARNPIPKQLDKKFTLADDMIDGITTNPGVAIVQNSAAVMDGVLAAARSAEALYQAKRQLQRTATTYQLVADSNNKTFIGKAKRQLIDNYGEQWNTDWAAVGYVNGSLAMPRTIGERNALVVTMTGFFGNNPTLGNTEKDVTAAAAAILYAAFSNARAALQNAKAETKDKFGLRETAVEELTTRMRGLIGELDTLLADDSPLWYAFGLNAPGDPETPGVPEAPELTQGAAGSGTLLVDWDDTRRADHYRVWRKLPGEADFTALASVSESDTVLNGQPLGTLLEIRITAVNDAGESLPGASATITLS